MLLVIVLWQGWHTTKSYLLLPFFRIHHRRIDAYNSCHGYLVTVNAYILLVCSSISSRKRTTQCWKPNCRFILSIHLMDASLKGIGVFMHN